jgi:hypothetical protein
VLSCLLRKDGFVDAALQATLPFEIFGNDVGDGTRKASETRLFFD